MRIVSRGMIIAFAAISFTGSASAAPDETVLYSFTHYPSDGVQPYAGLITDKHGALYGTTSSGGTRNVGTVFKLTPPAKGQTAWTETVLSSFLYIFKGTANGYDGAFALAGLIADNDGALYGTTAGGGVGNNGTVFKLTPPAKGQTAWTETVLCRFTGSDGGSPYAGLIADDSGALYGTTIFGRTSNSGVVFKLTPPAKGQTSWMETVLFNFKGGSDGSYPTSGLIADERGTLYGTTSSGGTGSSSGTVFKLTPPAKGQTAWTETVIYRFCSQPLCSDGSEIRQYPLGALIADKQGALYGTTAGGGVGNNGTVFKLTPPAKGQTSWTETVLYPFTGGSDGGSPYGGLIADNDGALYGTTFVGGTSNGGTVFKLTPPAKGRTSWTKTVLYPFTGGSDGGGPVVGLIADQNRALYGTTLEGGSSGTGTVFKLTLSP